jgi:hypothetical protein
LPAVPTEAEAAHAVELFIDAGATEAYFVLTAAGGREGLFAVVPVPTGADAASIEAAIKDVAVQRLLNSENVERVEGAVLAGNIATLTALRELNPVERTDLAAALAATSTHTLQIVVAPSEDHRQMIEQAPIGLPGLDSSLVRALSWASLGIDGPPRPKVKMVVQAVDPPGAQKLDAAGRVLLNMLVDRPEIRRNLVLGERIRQILAWKVDESTLSIALDDEQGDLSFLARATVLPMFVQAKAGADVAITTNNLKQIGLAMHNHHDTLKRFPAPATLNPDGKPLLSWRVALLPYLETGGQQLYERFHLDEPWDSPHNKTLIAKMPEVYRCRGSKAAEGKTVFVGPRNDGMIFGGPAGVMIRQITDGTSKTIGVVEVDDAHAIEWTKPDEWKFDPDKPVDGLGGHAGNGFHVLALDGSVHFILDTIDGNTLHDLLTFSGREATAFPE